MLRHSEYSTLRCGHQVIDLSVPIVMGILNTTPDSFYAPSRVAGKTEEILSRVEQMIAEGAAIIDVGGMSSRPGAKPVTTEEELSRVLPAIEAIKSNFPKTVISIDTYRAEVAAACIHAGATMVNDISGGQLDSGMLQLIADHQVAYVLMHLRGNPENMQYNTEYQSVVPDILKYFIGQLKLCQQVGIEEIIIDPGFGFAKTAEQNYQLVAQLGVFRFLNLPIMIGVSRKSTLSKTIGRPVEETLSATTALHMVALQNGASVLRVHDVEAAMDTIAVYNQLSSVNTLNNKRLSPE